jgi:hypothetical protein
MKKYIIVLTTVYFMKTPGEKRTLSIVNYEVAKACVNFNGSIMSNVMQEGLVNWMVLRLTLVEQESNR